MSFRVDAPYRPTGDQPRAIDQLVKGVEQGYKHQTLLGATATGKTFVMAEVFEKLQRPALVMAHNKTLVSQLYSEFRELLPDADWGIEIHEEFFDGARHLRTNLHHNDRIDLTRGGDRGGDGAAFDPCRAVGRMRGWRPEIFSGAPGSEC